MSRFASHYRAPCGFTPGFRALFVVDIPKREVWEAFKKVKANRGAAGVDGQSIAEFETALASNLYILWNRLDLPLSFSSTRS